MDTKLTLTEKQCRQLRSQLATVRRAINQITVGYTSETDNGNRICEALNWLAEAEKVAEGKKSTWTNAHSTQFPLD